MIENKVFYLDGGTGDILEVYEDRIVISHKGVLNFFAMGIKGDKTIYYNNITSVQLKKAGVLAGYIQFSIHGGRENIGGLLGATQDENTITINMTKNIEAERIVTYINKKLAEIREGGSKPTQVISQADEIKKFKELLDMGVITEEEFNAKKKQILGLW